jgi:hypothetical protein
MARASVRLASLPTQSSTTSAPPVRRSMSPSSVAAAVHEAAGERGARPGRARPGRRRRSAPSSALASAAGRGASRRHHEPGEAATSGQGGDGEQAEGAGADDGDGVVGPDVGGERGVDRAGGGLDHHRGLVAHVVGHRVQLARWATMASTSRRRCRSRSRSAARLEAAEGDALAVAEVAVGRRRAHRVDAARDAAEHRFEDDASVPSVQRRRRPRGRARTGTRRSARSSGWRRRRWWRGREPQMPARRGRISTQSAPGSSGGSMSSQLRAGRPAPRPGMRGGRRRRPRRSGGTSRSKRRAFIDRPFPAAALPPRDGSGSWRLERPLAAAAAGDGQQHRPGPAGCLVRSARPASPACGRGRRGGSRG